MFTLKGIYIGKGCKYRKCLQEDCYYPLENKMADDFFAPNIGITTIVGQNGAGKSSLLDVLFRMLNNIGFCLYGHVERNASDDMSYVLGLNADLHYTLNGKNGILHCRNRAVALEYGELFFHHVLKRWTKQVATMIIFYHKNSPLMINLSFHHK